MHVHSCLMAVVQLVVVALSGRGPPRQPTPGPLNQPRDALQRKSGGARRNQVRCFVSPSSPPPPSSSDAPEVRRRLMPSISAHTSDRGGDIDVVPPAKRQRGNAQQNHGSTGDVFQAQGGGDVSFFPPCDGTMMAVREDGSSMTAATTSASMQAQQPTNPLAPASEPTASASWTAALA